MTRSKFSLPRYDPFTAKPGLFLAQVVGESGNSTTTICFETKLWLTANKLPNNINVAELRITHPMPT